MVRLVDAGLKNLLVRSEKLWCVLLLSWLRLQHSLHSTSKLTPDPVHQVKGGGRGSSQTCCVSRYRGSGEVTEAEPGVRTRPRQLTFGLVVLDLFRPLSSHL